MSDLTALSRDSGFGDDYLMHHACVQFLAAVGDAVEVPVSEIPWWRRWCMHCLCWLDAEAHPRDRLSDEDFSAAYAERAELEGGFSGAINQ